MLSSFSWRRAVVVALSFNALASGHVLKKRGPTLREIQRRQLEAENAKQVVDGFPAVEGQVAEVAEPQPSIAFVTESVAAPPAPTDSVQGNGNGKGKGNGKGRGRNGALDEEDCLSLLSEALSASSVLAQAAATMSVQPPEASPAGTVAAEIANVAEVEDAEMEIELGQDQGQGHGNGNGNGRGRGRGNGQVQGQDDDEDQNEGRNNGQNQANGKGKGKGKGKGRAHGVVNAINPATAAAVDIQAVPEDPAAAPETQSVQLMEDMGKGKGKGKGQLRKAQKALDEAQQAAAECAALNVELPVAEGLRAGPPPPPPAAPADIATLTTVVVAEVSEA